MFNKSFLQSEYQLRKNPFPNGATYALDDTTGAYEPAMYGDQLNEFRNKFFVKPLESEQPILGALWSVSTGGDPQARGFGKSTLMGEESKLVNQDFGRTMFMEMGADEDEAASYPVLASYVSFTSEGANGIASIEAAGFHLLRFLLNSETANGISIHSQLHSMLVQRLTAEGKVNEGEEGTAVLHELRSYFRRLNVTIDMSGKMADFMLRIASPNADALHEFLGTKVTAWHQPRFGLKYLQLYTAFAYLSGIKHLTFFIDQIEDFTSISGRAKIGKNVKILRDALIESQPFKSCASFVFQLHPVAWGVLQEHWHLEDLRDLYVANPKNRPFVVNLEGLKTFESAHALANHYLNHPKHAAPGRKTSLHPFTEEALEYVWSNNQLPRQYLQMLNMLIEVGRDQQAKRLDLAFCKTILDGDEDTPRSARRTRSRSGMDSRLQ